MDCNICVLVAGIGILFVASPLEAYKAGGFNLIGCQGYTVPLVPCSNTDAIYRIKSITVLTSANVTTIRDSKKKCRKATLCRRTIHSPQDTGLSADYLYLYNWLVYQCEGRKTCAVNSTMPEWWALTDDFTKCGKGRTQHFVGALLDVECRVGEEPANVTLPPETTPKTRPTTPTTTTSFPVFIPVYMPGLIGRERIILGVVIGLAILILIFLLIILYCCEAYRTNKKFAKLLRMLGAPQAQDDVFDDFEDYGKSDAWKDETDASFDALGEYTGVKPDEFMTLDKRAMECSGQIMYDTQTGTMTMGRGNSCSTLGKNGRLNSHPSGHPAVNYGYSDESLDYDTAENLDLERRMAATLTEEPDYEEDRTYH